MFIGRNRGLLTFFQRWDNVIAMKKEAKKKVNCPNLAPATVGARGRFLSRFLHANPSLLTLLTTHSPTYQTIEP